MTDDAQNATAKNSPESLIEWVQNADESVASQTLGCLLAASPDQWSSDSQTVSSILVGLIRRGPEANRFDNESSANLLQIHREMDAFPAIQGLLLRLCIATETNTSLELFSELLTTTPTLPPRSYIEVFGDLLRCKTNVAPYVFPQLLDGLQTPGLASFVLDYANFALRNGLVDEHPAAPRVKELNSLLAQLADRLQQLQDNPPKTKEETVQRGKQVTESVALGIALSDALGCIGDPESVASLNKALGVEHRRLRVEAAAALVKLDVSDAKQLLTAMAAEPGERLRVLAYAEELDLLDEIEEEFSNIVARAEAEFVMYLSQPSQLGIPPQHIELIDQCEMAWPGYEEPRNCFLFQFVYHFPDAEFTNIGITGPVVMKFDADLTFLPREDIYSLFAGWHVQHPDIYALEAQRTAGADEIQMQRMLRSLTESDEYEDVRPALLGNLLDRKCLIAAAVRKEESGWAIVGEDSISWLTLGNPERPLGAGEAFYLFVGRSLLRSFN